MAPIGFELWNRIPSPRSIEGILPSCISHMRNVTTPMRVSGVVDLLSKPTVRKAEFFSGKRRDQEANAASRKATEIHNWADRAGNGKTHAERRLT